ncbi:MAG: DUF434 domain-containing protein [Myxococcota bacterium]
MLRTACAHLSWLLSRGYASSGALKLVGDRFALDRRQRQAVERCAVPEAAQVQRRQRAVGPEAVAERAVAIDGFNCLIVGEAALAGAPVFRGRDGAHRDIQGVHGTWRRVAETEAVLDALAFTLAAAASVTWVLDRPVSNSGRLSARIRDLASDRDLPWAVQLEDRADPALVEHGQTAIVATGDGWILDRVAEWIDLPAVVLASRGGWVLDLAG